MGVVLHFSLGVFALMSNRLAAAALALVFATVLVSFLRYNWYPGKVFPGDLNYTIGAVAACVAVLGNMEKFAILCFTPWVIEAVLKALSGFKAETFGVLQEDGTVKPREPKIRSLTHIVMRTGRFTEKQVTTILIGLEVAICFVAFTVIHFI
jgi:UDP-N-acetylglucosamine--dolichyl-phosphate N-acetylglucosaminephosphotransferase